MTDKGPILQLSPTETLRAVADKGKIGYVYEQEGSYEFDGKKMREKTKPKSVLVQGLIPAELFRTKPTEVMAFFEAHKDLCKPA